MVNTVNDSGINVGAWRRDDYFFRTTVQMSLAVALGAEYASTFKDHINTQLTPWQLGRIALRERLDFVAVDVQSTFALLNLSVKTTVNGVVLGQVSIDGGVTQVINGNNLVLIATACFVECAQNVATDTAIAINSNLDHDVSNTVNQSGKTALYSS